MGVVRACGRAGASARIGSLIGRCAALVLVASPAWALKVDTHLSCPSSVNPGQTIPIDVVIENQECTTVDVRLSTMLVSNPTQQGLGNTAIHGPVAVANVQLPAGDCAPPSGPSTQTLDDLPAEPAFPPAFAGKVAALVLITEWSGGVETDSCLLLPEPARSLQLGAGVLGLLLLGRLEARRARTRAERRR